MKLFYLSNKRITRSKFKFYRSNNSISEGYIWNWSTTVDSAIQPVKFSELIDDVQRAYGTSYKVSFDVTYMTNIVIDNDNRSIVESSINYKGIVCFFIMLIYTLLLYSL